MRLHDDNVGIKAVIYLQVEVRYFDQHKVDQQFLVNQRIVRCLTQFRFDSQFDLFFPAIVIYDDFCQVIF